MSIGERARRADAPDKAKGTALFVRDRAVAGVLEAGVLRSPHPHARILRLDVSGVRGMPGVRAVLTAHDVPARNIIPVIQTDWPVLADEYVRHVGEPVALVAAESRGALVEALAAVEVEYEPLAAQLDMDRALASGEIIAQWRVRRGEAAVALGRNDLVVAEDVYHVPAQAHASLEPNGVIARPDGAGGLVVEGAMESPFSVRQAVAAVLGWDANRVRVVQTVTGGGFGSKEEAAVAVGVQAGLLAAATGRPVRLALSRVEEMVATPKRHPARVRVRVGATPEGHLIGAEVDILLDGGAYATLTPLVLFQSAAHACGPYRVPNVRVDAKAVRTHRLPAGTFRGTGAAEVAFAFESQLNVLAERLQMDPLELRRKNALQAGDETITGQRLEASAGLTEVLSEVEQASDWVAKRSLFSHDGGAIRRGIGVAASYNGIGLGPVGRTLQPGAGASIVVAPDGSVAVAVGATDTGQGEGTVLAQIAAEALACPIELVRLLETDTSRVPDGGPSSGSRATVVTGAAIRDAAAKVRAAIEGAGGDGGLGWKESVFLCAQKHVGLAAHGWAVPPEPSFDLATGQGEAYPAYTFSACVVEVEVDRGTGETRVVRATSGHDVGRVLNPATAEGQVEGGVVLGLGQALLEEHAPERLGPASDGFGAYSIPACLDAPEVRSIFVEHPYPWGPWGAKGLSDAPPIATVPAVLAAIGQATGVRLRTLPATPERVLEALHALEGAARG
jgi:CO/xanthine dehydrogenase Mo-binding subunit